jgi:hypothetical protein
MFIKMRRCRFIGRVNLVRMAGMVNLLPRRPVNFVGSPLSADEVSWIHQASIKASVRPLRQRNSTRFPPSGSQQLTLKGLRQTEP